MVHLLALLAVLNDPLEGRLLVNALGEPLDVLGSTRGHHSCFLLVALMRVLVAFCWLVNQYGMRLSFMDNS
ncbi:hypothetical protein MT325_m827L [Paramecium bursaria chlorella virus MT325]|uniref:Uncharacterized protein m827L n=1 Tax=Paramecium bursaria Chlorella virus MT325 TaxID=346932 RepID=A7IVK7_PBCVM|nr:hypothetical protein MT325_m827L [Paramecium bursaria chlorella virus MT325]